MTRAKELTSEHGGLIWLIVIRRDTLAPLLLYQERRRWRATSDYLKKVDE